MRPRASSALCAIALCCAAAAAAAAAAPPAPAPAPACNGTFVVDGLPRHYYNAELLLFSLRRFGAQPADSILVHVTTRVAAPFLDWLSRTGARRAGSCAQRTASICLPRAAAATPTTPAEPAAAVQPVTRPGQTSPPPAAASAAGAQATSTASSSRTGTARPEGS